MQAPCASSWDSWRTGVVGRGHRSCPRPAGGGVRAGNGIDGIVWDTARGEGPFVALEAEQPVLPDGSGPSDTGAGAGAFPRLSVRGSPRCGSFNGDSEGALPLN